MSTSSTTPAEDAGGHMAQQGHGHDYDAWEASASTPWEGSGVSQKSRTGLGAVASGQLWGEIQPDDGVGELWPGAGVAVWATSASAVQLRPGVGVVDLRECDHGAGAGARDTVLVADAAKMLV